MTWIHKRNGVYEALVICRRHYPWRIAGYTHIHPISGQKSMQFPEGEYAGLAAKPEPLPPEISTLIGEGVKEVNNGPDSLVVENTNDTNGTSNE